MPRLRKDSNIQVLFTAAQVADLLRVLEKDERLHPSEAMQLAKVLREAVKEAEDS